MKTKIKSKLLTAALLIGLGIAPVTASAIEEKPKEPQVATSEQKNDFQEDYQNLIKLALNPEVGKSHPMSMAVQKTFPACNSIRYLETKQTEDKGDGREREIAKYFTTFSFKDGDKYTTFRVRLVLEEIISNKKNRYIKTLTFEDGGFGRAESNGMPDGKVDQLISARVKQPVTRSQDYEVSYEDVTPETQKVFDKAVKFFLDAYKK